MVHALTHRSSIMRCLLAACLLLVGVSAAMAGEVAVTPHFKAQLIAESRQPAAGHTLTLGLRIEPQAGWHIYWQNPGEAGLAPELDWTLPVGVTAGAPKHPVPSRLMVGDIASNVHDGPVVLLTDLAVPAWLKKGSALPVQLDAELLVCSEGRCVPQDVSLDLPLAVGNGAPDGTRKTLFAQARARLPRHLKTPGRFATVDGGLRLFLPGVQASDVAHVAVFADDEVSVPADSTATLSGAGNGLLVKVAGDIPPKVGKLAGVLRLTHADGSVSGLRFTALPGAVPDPSSGGGFLLAFAGALLGGLLLNLMPCVFPILSLKAMALARAGGNEAEARSEALGYTAGAIGVLLALGLTVLMLREGGHAAGWAFQLQDVRVVAVLLLLVTAIACNMAGLFELPSLQASLGQKAGFLGGLGTGALAAFIATPCTGPFMAGALGVAMVLPIPAALAVFAGLGFGLAAPFLALGFIKPLRKWLPKPGAWMLTLRRILSLPMFATALGLAWIVGRQAGVAAMTMALAAALLLGMALWWWGLRQGAGKKSLPAVLPAAVALMIALFGMQSSLASGGREHLLASQPYSAAKLASLRAQHRPVFVYLTADWCLSCKVNEATSLSAASVAKAFEKDHVAVLEGDWTKGDPEVSKLLAQRGRAGVPLYIWYPPDGSARELPQVLTPSMLIDLTKRA